MTLIVEDGKLIAISAEALQGVPILAYDGTGALLERVTNANLRTGRVERVSASGYPYAEFVVAPITLIHKDTGCRIEYIAQLDALSKYQNLAIKMSARWEALRWRIDRGFMGLRLRARLALNDKARVLEAHNITMQIMEPDEHETFYEAEGGILISPKYLTPERTRNAFRKHI